jgi:ATPase complex subunit ATP10
MKPSQLLLLRSLALNTPSRLCYSCATRQFRSSALLNQAQAPTPQEPKRTPLSPIQPDLPKDPSKFELKPLGRPIGAPYPPKPGDNDPKDHRTIAQRKADFTNYDKHLERRKELTAAVAKPYFRDWKNLKYARGKGWIANERLWKRDASLYMPNLAGRTLSKDGDSEAGLNRNMVNVLKGRISIVCIFSKTWAENQVKTWISTPEIQDLINTSGGRAQIVEANVEEKPLYRAVLKLFEWGIRSAKKKENWDKYFFLTGIPQNVQEMIGVINSNAGYVYLVDGECRIRWAGSGDADEGEKLSLERGLRRLIEERTKKATEVREGNKVKVVGDPEA